LNHLIDPQWFASLSQIALLGIGALSIIAILKAADYLVDGASGLARNLGLSELIVGATIVSLGTTTPEAAVSVLAAWTGNTGLALGNAVGSIIADTALVFGVGCMMMRIPAERSLLNRQGWLQLLSGALLAALAYGSYMMNPEDPTLGRNSGIMLLALLVIYMWFTVKWGRASQEPREENDEDSTPIWADSLRFLLGLIVVIVAGQVLVNCVEVLAARWGVSQLVIASTIVAFGTSLPELVVSITAVRTGHPGLLVGNVIGADILNVLFVVGSSAFAADLPLVNQEAPNPTQFLDFHLPFMMGTLILFRILIVPALKRGEFHKRQGIPLVMVYLVYLTLNGTMMT